MDAITEFYEVCDLFDDDIGLVVLAFKELSSAKEKPSTIKYWCESLKVDSLSGYATKILDTPIAKINRWKVNKQKGQRAFDFTYGGYRKD